MGARSGPEGNGRRRGFYEGLRAGLIDFAEAQVALGARQEDGSTLRELLMSLAARGTIDRRLTRRPPPETAMLWRVYVEVPARPLTPSELLAWQQLTGIRLTPWEVDTLLYMDRVVADAARKQGG